MKRRTLIATLLILPLLTGCGGGGPDHAERLADLEEAYEAVVAIKAATEVGVNYVSYGPRVADAAAALAVYEPEDDKAREVAAYLSAALDDYSAAGEAWSVKLLSYPQSHSRWAAFASTHSGLVSDLGLSERYALDSDIDRMVQALWARAAVYMEAAREGLATYRQR